MDKFYIPNLEAITAEVKDKLTGEHAIENAVEAYKIAKMIDLFYGAFPEISDEDLGAFVKGIMDDAKEF